MTLAEFNRLFLGRRASYETQGLFIKACDHMVPVLLEIARTAKLMDMNANNVRTSYQPLWFEEFHKALGALKDE